MAIADTAARPPIAANLRRLKLAGDWTWPEVARGAEVNERQLMEWQRGDGRYQPSWRNLLKLAEFFDVDPSEFYKEP